MAGKPPPPNEDHLEAANALFTAKWPTVQKVVGFHAHHLGIRGPEYEDLLQCTALVLWRQCLRCVEPGGRRFKISADVIGLAGFWNWKHSRKPLRARRFSDLDDPEDERRAFDAPAKAAEIRVHDDDGGAMVAAHELAAFAPELCERYRGGVSRAAIARNAGVSLDTVRRSPERFGGMFYPGEGTHGRWLFPNGDTGPRQG